MSTNMIECGICRYHFSSMREHCPTCGTEVYQYTTVAGTSNIILATDRKHYHQIVVAHGAERARQLPQSPRFFQLVD